MSVRKSDDFIADVERQFEWYVANAGWGVADHYLDSVEATCRLLGQHPLLGPRGAFSHPRLRDWRFFVVFRPFKKHVLFYGSAPLHFASKSVSSGTLRRSRGSVFKQFGSWKLGRWYAEFLTP